MNRKLNEEQTIIIINLLNLAKTIADKYSSSIEPAINGLLIGLNKYSQNNRIDTKIDLYVVWYIKTSVEYSIGIKNEDTAVWSKMLKIK